MPSRSVWRAIVVALALIVGGAAVASGGFGFTKYVAPLRFAEIANTPTGTRIPATSIPAATPQKSLAMTSGQHVLVTCPQTLSLAVGQMDSDLACLSAPVTLTPVPPTSTVQPDATATLGLAPTDTPIVLPTDTATVVPTDTPSSTATGVPSATPTPSPSATVLPTGTLAPTGTVLAIPTAAATVIVTGPTRYVDHAGNNSDGRSPATAWTELGNINWASINPGDTILVAPGTYLTTLLPVKSGTASAPITVRASGGQVNIFGGRSTPLPYCQQTTYTYQTAGVRLHGIDFSGASYVVVDGGTWRGITITGHNDSGVKLSGSHNTIRNAEITDNGQANYLTAGYWRPDRPGVSPSGSDNTLDRDIIHDNGQDTVQTGSALTNFTISNSWSYNGRVHPSYGANIPWNYCMHSDGIQIYDGGTSSGITIDHSVIGPGHMQGTILGQTPGRSVVNNVTIKNTLFIDDFNANIMGYGGTASQNWTMDHITTFMISYPGNYVSPLSGWSHSILVEGSGHRLTNSVVYGGDVSMPSGTVYSGNCQFGLTGGSIGTNADPQFTRKPTNTSLADSAAADFTVHNPSCAGKGSSITSVAMLLAQ